METVKTTADHIIVKKRSGRYGVITKKGKNWVNGEDKTKVLLAEGLIKQSVAQEKPAQTEGGEGDDASDAGASES